MKLTPGGITIGTAWLPGVDDTDETDACYCCAACPLPVF